MEEKLKLNFLAGVQVESDVYFSAWSMNGLFKYNPELDKCDFLKTFPGEEKWGLHSEAILYKNTIWFIPRASERIAIVDLTSLDITYLELPEYGHRPKGHISPIRMRGHYITGGNFLFIIPFAYKLFIKIDMDKREIVSVENWGGDEYAHAIGVVNQNWLIIYINKCNKMRLINVLSDTYIEKNIVDREVVYTGIQNLDEKILLFPIYLRDGIVFLNKKDDEERIVHLDDNNQWYYDCQVMIGNKELLLIPYEGTKSVRISMKDGCCHIKQLKDLGVQENAYCSSKMFYNNEIWYLSHVLENSIICYDKRKDAIVCRDIEISQRKYNEDIIENLERYGIEYSPLSDMTLIHEQYFFLNTFLQLVKIKKCHENEITGEAVGMNIYESLL